MTEYKLGTTKPKADPNGDYIVEVESDGTTRYLSSNGAYRVLRVSLSDGQLKNDGTDTETVTIKAVSGLDVARGDRPTVLDYDGDVTISVGGVETTKTITGGSTEFDLSTDKPAGSVIEIVAESLADHPSESDSATIKVVPA